MSLPSPYDLRFNPYCLEIKKKKLNFFDDADSSAGVAKEHYEYKALVMYIIEQVDTFVRCDFCWWPSLCFWKTTSYRRQVVKVISFQACTIIRKENKLKSGHLTCHWETFREKWVAGDGKHYFASGFSSCNSFKVGATDPTSSWRKQWFKASCNFTGCASSVLRQLCSWQVSPPSSNRL